MNSTENPMSREIEIARLRKEMEDGKHMASTIWAVVFLAASFVVSFFGFNAATYWSTGYIVSLKEETKRTAYKACVTQFSPRSGPYIQMKKEEKEAATENLQNCLNAVEKTVSKE